MTPPVDRELQELLSALVDGELSPADERALRARIAGDAAASAELARLTRLRELLLSEEPPPPPADLAARISARSREERFVVEGDEPAAAGPRPVRAPRAARGRRWALPMAAAASVLVAALLGVLLLGDRLQAPAPSVELEDEQEQAAGSFAESPEVAEREAPPQAAGARTETDAPPSEGPSTLKEAIAEPDPAAPELAPERQSEEPKRKSQDLSVFGRAKAAPEGEVSASKGATSDAPLAPPPAVKEEETVPAADKDSLREEAKLKKADDERRRQAEKSARAAPRRSLRKAQTQERADTESLELNQEAMAATMQDSSRAAVEMDYSSQDAFQQALARAQVYPFRPNTPADFDTRLRELAKRHAGGVLFVPEAPRIRRLIFVDRAVIPAFLTELQQLGRFERPVQTEAAELWLELPAVASKP